MHRIIWVLIFTLFSNFGHAQHAPAPKPQPNVNNNQLSEESLEQVKKTALHLACDIVKLPARTMIFRRNGNVQLNPAWILAQDKIKQDSAFEVGRVFEYFINTESPIRPTCDLYMLQSLMKSSIAEKTRAYCSSIKTRLALTNVLSSNPNEIYAKWEIPNPDTVREQAKTSDQVEKELQRDPKKLFLHTVCPQNIPENALACEYLEMKALLDSLPSQKEAARQALKICSQFE